MMKYLLSGIVEADPRIGFHCTESDLPSTTLSVVPQARMELVAPAGNRGLSSCYTGPMEPFLFVMSFCPGES